MMNWLGCKLQQWYGARFSPGFALEDGIGAHACSLEANMCVTNSIPLGCPLLLPVDTVYSVQTLKDASYVAQRKEQFEVEAELRRKFAVELPAGQQMVDRHTLGIKQESSNGGGGGESAGITNGNGSGATSPATSISPTLSSTSASTMSSGITSPTTPHPPGWNDATLATFTNGLKSHGKNFHRISLDMLKGKKTANELRDYFKLHKSDRGLDAHVQVYFDRLRGLGVTGSNPG
jgi:hypothetical protein